ncbi:alpha-L-rhamnosidase [Arachidicoccus rhizosphaerae]|uniref:alpha-L-rhamnosidase n=1 Tax=Arachidicoccus rhizosphaerae TaxID=551991 RepID=A0A1H3XKB2_9BACT|nr:alpha-L-rhamnosidase [Arachidicoccus rhizosphaerae]SDZ98988.1 alpha-L-rhamnosidase [Arachidicoccus rhizosphaerae]
MKETKLLRRSYFSLNGRAGKSLGYKWIFCCLLLCTSSAMRAQIEVEQGWVENKINPMGVAVAQPRFSFASNSTGKNVVQTAYEIRVATSVTDLQKDKKLIWNSGKVNTDQSLHVVYQGAPLKSAQKYFWQVKVWDNQKNESKWSEPADFTTGMMEKQDWKATWIEPGYKEDSILRPSPLLRKEFKLNKNIQSARVIITAHGLYEAFINGKKVGNAFLTPGWTSYNKRLQYQTYDVTDLVKAGDNAVGVMLGSGWYRGTLAWGGNHNLYGKTLGVLFQLEITYTDGTTATVLSDGSWKSATGEIRYAEIYNGETIDHRQTKTGWTAPGFKDNDWTPVKVVDDGYDNLVTTQNELVQQHESFKPIKVITTPSGEKVLDFGQNLVGWVDVKLKGKAGDTVKIFHAEVLDKAGNFYTTNLRMAKAEDQYILSGKGEESFHPHFTWHGFRYIRVEGVDGPLNPDDFTAVTLYSAMPQTGQFSSSDSLINQLQHNIEWGLRGNFLDVPTDCPQRDERLGWTGDAEVFSRTASFIRNVNSFFDKWMQDVAADQLPDGRVAHVVPNVLGEGSSGAAGWADVATIIPWNMYLAYGDKQILEKQYASMKAWVDYIKSVSKDNLWNTGYHFGDWLFYHPDDDNDGRAAVTDKYLIAQCFYAHSTQLLINAASVLGRSSDVTSYSALLKDIKAAFLKEYVTPSGRLVSSTQTAYVLALNFDMLPENLRAQAAKRLVENIHSYGDHITTGFLGTPFISAVLTRFGYSDVAYQLLLQKTYPSWLYPVKMGATTIWERWDGIKQNGDFENAGMNSFNHYAYGAIGDWMYRKMVGLDTYEDAPGYKHNKIQPYIGGGFTSARASLKTYFGTLSNSWQLSGSNLSMDIEIPVNTTSTVFVPTTNPASVALDGKSLNGQGGQKAEVLPAQGTSGQFVKLELGSGRYHLTSTFVQDGANQAKQGVKK